jgi:arsenate reductase (glutaredoxin)
LRGPRAEGRGPGRHGHGTLYGIANCDTMKKARAWLDGHGVEYVFHDYKKAGIDEALVRGWVAELGWEALVNRRGTTWRRLPESAREGIDAESAIRLMVEHPSSSAGRSWTRARPAMSASPRTCTGSSSPDVTHPGAGPRADPPPLGHPGRRRLPGPDGRAPGRPRLLDRAHALRRGDQPLGPARRLGAPALSRRAHRRGPPGSPGGLDLRPPSSRPSGTVGSTAAGPRT